MRRIAVTGSSGFIGRPLVQYFRRQNLEVVEVDLCPEGSDVRALSAAGIAGLDGVIHLGAMSRAIWGELHPARCMELNATAVATLLRQVRAAQPAAWVLLASSKEVYGDSGLARVHEDADLKPKGVYARSKVQAEAQLREAAAQHGQRCGIARLSTVYGGLGDHEERLIPHCVSAALTGRTLAIDAAASVLDPTHVQDVVRGLASFAAWLHASRQAGCTAINLCGGQGFSIGNIVEAVSASAPQPIVTRPGTPRPFMSHAFVGDNGKARDLLGWAPKTPFHDGIRAYVELLSAQKALADAFRRRDLIDQLVAGTERSAVSERGCT